MSSGRADAPKFVAKMLEGRSEIDVNGCLVASMSAFGEEDFQQANRFLKRAFELDLASALRQTVMRFSAQTSKILEGAQSVDEMASWLTERSEGDLDFTLMPSSLAPEALAVSRRLRQQALERGLPSPILITHARRRASRWQTSSIPGLVCQRCSIP